MYLYLPYNHLKRKRNFGNDAHTNDQRAAELKAEKEAAAKKKTKKTAKKDDADLDTPSL